MKRLYKSQYPLVGPSLHRLILFAPRLVQIQIVVRHGIRTSWDLWPKTDKPFWKKQLTDPHPQITLPKYQVMNSITNEVLKNYQTLIHYNFKMHFITWISITWTNLNTIQSLERTEDADAPLLLGGAKSGALTQKGMEQCYQLGKRIRYCHSTKWRQRQQ